MFAAKSVPGLLLSLTLLLPAGSALVAAEARPDARPTSSLAGLAETIEAGRERFGIPGMAVGVVHDRMRDKPRRSGRGRIAPVFSGFEN